MKKAFKIIGTIVKAYIVLDLAIWAGVGISDVLAESAKPENGYLSPIELDDKVFDKAAENYKLWWRTFMA